ncbi:MAG: hypothetical protein KF753_23280 [Caldilineaceae bacterium]|nr:hypothetical protein [Caldilineaceae bacterium]
MTRTVYIDLSAKIEEWSADSAIAMTNGGETVFLVRARVKRQARDWLKKSGNKRREAVYIYRLLSALVYLISAPELSNIELLIIDADYPGTRPAAAIRNELVPLLQRERRHFSGKRIRFQQVKGSKADRLARDVFRGKIQAQREITLEEIVSVWE